MHVRASWQDEILRHKQRLDADLVSREIGVALTCLVFAFFLPAGIVLAVYAICVATEFVDYAAFRTFAQAPTRVAHAAILLNSVVALSAYSLLGVVAWQSGDPFVRFAGLISLVGALINVSAARATHLPLGIACGLPPAAALLWIGAQQALAAGPAFGSHIFAGLSIIVLVGYFGSALVQNHRAETRLAAETRRANDASRAKSRFLAEMSHEVRTPLNTILGLSQSLQGGGSPDPSLQAASIETAARSLAMLVDDVLDLASAEEGAVVVRPVTAPVRQEVFAIAQALALREGAGRTARLPDVSADVPELARFDAALLRKLAVHVGAALRSGGTAGSAVPHLRCGLADGKPDRLRIDVLADADAASGVEIAPAASALAATLTERLASVLGADIAWTSLGPGDRRATIVVPISPVPELPRPDGLADGGGLRALVVDDLSTNRFVIVQLLRLLRIEATEAGCGEAALAALDRAPHDVVLLDMNMPGMTGEATFRAIRGSGRPWAAIPVIAVTADALPEQRDAYLALGLDGYVAKPVDKRLLWAEIVAAVPPRS